MDTAGFQAAMRVGAMQPAMAARAPSTAMLVDPAMLDTTAIVEAPTQLLALKSEADEIIDTVFSLVFPVGTALGLAVRRRSPPFSRARACSIALCARRIPHGKQFDSPRTRATRNPTKIHY